MRLKKGLGLSHVFAIASGAMISSGIFVLPGLAYARAGPAVVVSYLLAGLLATTGLLSIAELATAMPKAGGDYFFVARGMGPAVGTVAGLLTWFSLTLKSAFALVGMAAFARLIVPVDEHIVGIVFCAVFVGLNLKGAKEVARLQVALVAGLFALMLVYIVRGLPAVQLPHFEPFAPGGMRAVFATVGFVFVSYGGLLKVASVSEEVERPGRTIPLGMILSLLSVVVCYTLMVFVTIGVLGSEGLSRTMESRTPISDGAAVFMGNAGRIALSIGAILAFVSTANAGILAASRYLLALSRDKLLPPRLGVVGKRFGTPHVAILITGGLAAGALFLKLDILVEAASLVLVLSYILSNLAIIVLRESRLQNYQPRFRAPLYPWVQLVGILGLAFVIVEMGEEAYLICAILVLIGFGVYWFYGRARAERESALLHLVQRITARELVTGTLEAELKQIIRERDDIAQDRFDRIIEDCVVLDLDDGLDVETLFQRVAEGMAERLNASSEKLLALLREREEMGSTVIHPGIAIPHMVIEGNEQFDILLARSKKGVLFSESGPPVHAVFVLIGSEDERNFHLRALAAIAQIVQAPDFQARWLAARTPQALRDIFLLGTRLRG